jgi:DNA repair exonuclease SbcCD nuclease subunit
LAEPVLRFLHASDLRLHEPVTGPVDPPETLRQALLEAPYEAARRAFDAALENKVDFVLLTGDTVDYDIAGPRGLVFLAEQFGRLEREGVTVYWLGLGDPADLWPAQLPLGKNVVRVGTELVEHVHRRGGNAIARIMTAEAVLARRAPAVKPETSPPIVVLAGGDPPQRFEGELIPRYWALAGCTERRNVLAGPTQAHDPGSPQGRTIDEVGAHGCTLVEVDRAGEATLRIVPTDVCRWVTQTVELERPTDEAQIERLLHDRVALLQQSSGPRETLVHWTIKATKAAAAFRWHDALVHLLVDRLNRAYASASPGVFCCGLELEQAALEVEANSESFFGQFLASLEELTAEDLSAEDDLPVEPNARRIVERTARLGRSLLVGEEPAR